MQNNGKKNHLKKYAFRFIFEHHLGNILMVLLAKREGEKVNVILIKVLNVQKLMGIDKSND
jgi:hypothetical protein